MRFIKSTELYFSHLASLNSLRFTHTHIDHNCVTYFRANQSIDMIFKLDPVSLLGCMLCNYFVSSSPTQRPPSVEEQMGVGRRGWTSTRGCNFELKCFLQIIFSRNLSLERSQNGSLVNIYGQERLITRHQTSDPKLQLAGFARKCISTTLLRYGVIVIVISISICGVIVIDYIVNIIVISDYIHEETRCSIIYHVTIIHCFFVTPSFQLQLQTTLIGQQSDYKEQIKLTHAIVSINKGTY